jgi:hypothetical protein
MDSWHANLCQPRRGDYILTSAHQKQEKAVAVRNDEQETPADRDSRPHHHEKFAMLDWE